MKLLDKLKDALFEEEYEEVEDIEVVEKPKKEKKKKKKDVQKIKEEKRFSDVKVTNFDDVEDEDEEPVAKKIAVEKEDTKEIKYEEKSKSFNFPVDDDDFASGELGLRVTEIDDIKKEMPKYEPIREKKKEKKPEVSYKPHDDVVLYQTTKEEAYVKNHTKHEYGGIRNKEKKSFKPSPNISPVYGIIGDDNANVSSVPDREVRLTSALRSDNINLDDVRRKAYGVRDKEEIDNEPLDASIADDIAIDLTEEKDAPKVKKVTMGDALEYYQDLGLEYNNDYIDEKKVQSSGRRVSKQSKNVESDELPSFLQEKSEVREEVQVEEADDDNLFDLIDSMYDK